MIIFLIVAIVLAVALLVWTAGEIYDARAER